MSLFSEIAGRLKSAIGGTEGVNSAEGLSQLLAQTPFGSLQGMVQRLEGAGLENIVNSWLGKGENLPISGDQLKSALGNEQIRQFAEKSGLPVDAALAFLASRLPSAVDAASPNGTIDPSKDPGQTARASGGEDGARQA